MWKSVWNQNRLCLLSVYSTFVHNSWVHFIPKTTHLPFCVHNYSSAFSVMFQSKKRIHSSLCMCRSQTYSNSLIWIFPIWTFLNNVCHLVACRECNVFHQGSGQVNISPLYLHMRPFTFQPVVFSLYVFNSSFAIPRTKWTISFVGQLVNTDFCTVFFVSEILFCMLQDYNHVLNLFNDCSDFFNTMVLALCAVNMPEERTKWNKSNDFVTN